MARKLNGLLRTLRHDLPIAVVVVAGVVMSALAYWLSSTYIESEHVRQKFEVPASALAMTIGVAFDRYVEAVRSVSWLYAASTSVERDEFSAFVERSLSTRPGVQALEWIPRVAASQRSAYEARARDDGYRDFQITERATGGDIVTAAPRETYYPVYFIEPYQGNERALGFDLGSNPARRETLDRARDTGKPVATQRITLEREAGRRFGVLVFVPVYDGAAAPETVAGRRRNLSGFVLGVLRIGDIIDAAVDVSGVNRDLDIYLFDAAAAAGQTLLHARSPSLSGAQRDSLHAAAVSEGPAYSAAVDVAGRHWTLIFKPPAGDFAHGFHIEAAGFAATVLVLTALLLQYLVWSRNRTAQIELLVERRSRELTVTNAALEAEVAERKHIQLQLTQTQKMEAIGQLTGGIAHDFNNLLMVVDGYARRAVVRLDDTTTVQSSLLQVLSATDKAAKLTQQLLAFSRRQIMETRVFRVADAIKELDGLLKQLVGEAAAIQFELDDDARVETDPSELGQAVVNLAINARDAMPKGGTITIGARLVDLDAAFTEGRANIGPGRFVEVYVGDDGVGIDEATLARVFEPFFTTKGQGEGTGLGLAMVYGFAQQSGGTTEMFSTPGEGTTVSIYLPATTREPEMALADVDVMYHGQGETVLLVEDNQALLDLTRSVIEDLGYAVLTATDGVEALEVDEDHEEPIDLLLSDVVMPIMDGFELAEIMRENRPEMKILFMTGYPRSTGSPSGKLLQKPIKAIALARYIRNELGHIHVLAGDSASVNYSG